MRPADDGCLCRHRAYIVARARIAIAGKIGFEEIALRLGLALEGPQLDLSLAQARSLRLHIVEAAAERCLPGAGDLGLVLEALDDLDRLAAKLRPDIGKLCGELLDARMGRQKGRRQLGQLALHLDALVDEPSDRSEEH